MKILLENWREYLAEEEDKKIIALVPGKFKPPHAGHLEMVKHYAELKNVDIVKVMISPIPKDGVSWEDSKAIWEIYLRDAGIYNVTVMRSPQNSPVGAVFDYVGNKDNDPALGQPGDQVILGASTKGGDESRFAGNVQKYAREGITVLDPMKYVFNPAPSPLDATDFRSALVNKEDITPWLPITSQGEESVEEITNILDANSEEEDINETSS